MGSAISSVTFRRAAENLRVRAMLMAAVVKYIRQEEMTQAEAALKLGVSQPRISDLMRGKIDVFSVDTLIAMLARAGLKVKIQITKTKVPRIPCGTFSLPRCDFLPLDGGGQVQYH
ncbi:MAG: XRE family transcriptional regulator [Armatimonadetes bacterium]|nr:XRE family transcriptional regulator [Armatimonadota bacterium]